MTFAKVAALLEEGDAKDIVVFGGGSIPEADIPELEKLGVAKVFTPARRRHSAESGSAPTSPPTDCAAPKSRPIVLPCMRILRTCPADGRSWAKIIDGHPA